ncbi:AfsR/SARP family transcriptional regulator [Allokutzneria albata]|uniref:DNA-binding transcriptional activator of the SARP family n=1 Tax=Allokutzneria albata TaxID=211114 RepID=A0A1H0D887_ALLAB|nr:BTAD domain-containing putative transcriptional regulator [Allokutzneria albata]SDN66343.1 DNA-binding transcriptional activator of the SARP family [Allokutzneria albata]
MEFRVLGDLEVRGERGRIPVNGKRQRALLAVLLLRAGQVVGVDELVASAWPDRPAAAARKQVKIAVSGLRKVFAGSGGDPGVIVTRSPGYLVELDGHRLDLRWFEALVRTGRAAARREDKARYLGEALEEFRGPVLPGIGVDTEALEQRRAEVTEEYAELELELGRGGDLVPALTRLVERYPLRERLHGLLMTALHRSGRQTEALRALDAARAALTEPGAYLLQVEQQITAAPLEIRPAQLPADIGDLTGRIAEADQLCATLTGPSSGYAPPLAVITGAVGTGKSALGVRVGHRLRTAFPDGQLYVDLRDPVSTMDALAGFLRALGSPVPEGPAERTALYRSVLAQRRVLVVLDNVADEEQVAPLLPGAGDCAVLVTSRRRLTGLAGAHRVELTGLSSQESLALLSTLAGEHRVAAEQLAARRIAFLCEGLPLALRIVGAKLADHPQWTLQRLSDRLADDACRLTELRHGGLDLRATLASSVHALGPHAGRLFRRLGLLGFSEITPAVAGALAGVSSEKAARLLESLAASRVLLAGGEDRYRMPDLFRLLAREHCAPEGEGRPAQVGLGVLT